MCLAMRCGEGDRIRLDVAFLGAPALAPHSPRMAPGEGKGRRQRLQPDRGMGRARVISTRRAVRIGHQCDQRRPSRDRARILRRHRRRAVARIDQHHARLLGRPPSGQHDRLGDILPGPRHDPDSRAFFLHAARRRISLPRQQARGWCTVPDENGRRRYDAVTSILALPASCPCPVFRVPRASDCAKPCTPGHARHDGRARSHAGTVLHRPSAS